MMLCVLVTFSYCFIVQVFGQFNVTKTVPSGDDLEVAAVAGAENVVIVCQIIDSTTSSPLRTQWQFISTPGQGGTILLFDDNGLSNSQHSANFMTTQDATLRRNLTILSFTETYDNTQIGCGFTGNIEVRFDLKIIKLPVLLQLGAFQRVAESSAFSFSLESSSGFPLIPDTYQWSIGSDIIPIDSVNPNISVYPNITFTSVHRNDSGNYSISVTNGAGTTNGYFILDVQYGPEGVANAEGTRYVLVGTTNVTMIGFSSVNGNPSPSSSWSLDESAVVPGDRLSTDINGQLSISSVQLNDTGNYTNTLMNTVTGQDMSIDNTVELMVLDRAGPPVAVVVSDVTDTSVTLNWSPPDYLGVPQLSYYQLTLVPFSSIDVIITTNTTNTTTLVVNDLLPNTVYNISIVAVSTGDSFDILLGDLSNIVTIVTLTGAPLISDSNGISINGSILISWSLVHTGGLPIDQYNLYCSADQHYNGGAESDRISKILLCQMNECSDDELSGSSVLGPVMIGTVYSCSISVINIKGIDSRLINNIIIHEQGLPSVPVVLSSTVINNDILSLITSVTYAGNIDGSFRMIVDIYPQMTMDEQSPYFNRYVYNYPMYNDRGIVTVNISGLNPGIYTLVITSSNRFGESINKATVQAMINKSTDISSVLSSCDVSTITLLPSTSNSVTVVSNTSDSIVIGSSVGIAIIFMIAIVELVILLVIVFYRRRGNKGTRDNNLSVKPHPPPMYDVVEVKSTTTDQSSLQDNSDITVRTNEAYGELIPVYM